MLIDAQLLFADNQTLGGAAVSDNIVDFRTPRDIGVGENIYLGVSVTDAIVGTLAVELQTDDNEAFASATTTKVALTFPAAAPAGSILFYRISPGDVDERYLRLNFTGATGGDVKAFMTKDINAFKAYAIGYTIS